MSGGQECQFPGVGAHSLGSLLHGLAEVTADEDRMVRGVALDSRRVIPDDLFIAVPGDRSDGRSHIGDAVRRGAVAVVHEPFHSARQSEAPEGVPVIAVEGLSMLSSEIASRFYYTPSRRMRVVGITGTNGKTTCAWLLAQALDRLGERCAVMGTTGSGFTGELESSDLTTGDAVYVQRTLARLLEQGARAVCMEVSSHGLEQGRVNAVHFDVALFTNLSQDHLDYHGSMENYANAKRRLFHLRDLTCAVINTDDAFGVELLREHGAENCISYGLADAEVTASDVQLDETGITLEVASDGESIPVHCRLIGRVNVINLLATVAALLGCGYRLQQIGEVLPEMTAPPGRMELFRGGEGLPAVVVDYAHTPDALQQSLAALADLCRGSLTVVFGCGGDRDRGKRSMMGTIAARFADRVIVTDDNPRSEDPAVIADDILAGMDVEVPVIHNRGLAIETAIRQAGDADIVLVAGKGHETTQTTGDQVRPLSDRDEVRRLLEVLS